LIERANGHIHPFRAAVIGEKERRPAAGGKRPQSIGVFDFPQPSAENFYLLALNLAPGNKRRRTRAPTVNAMTIADSSWWILQSVAHSAAETAAANC
jgi:hypothetical protein